MSRTFAVVTLGCARNEVDSDQIGGLLSRHGYRQVVGAQDADVVLVNTCTFITPATEESVDTVLAACDLKEDATAQAVFVVGCMAERYKDELAASIPEADAVIGFGGYPQLPRIVDEVLAGRPVPRFVGGRDRGPGARRAQDVPGRSDGGASPLPLIASGPAPTSSPPDAPGPVSSSAAVDRPDPVSGSAAVDRLDPVSSSAAVDRPDPVSSSAAVDRLDAIPETGPRFPIRQGTGDRPWAYLKIAGGCDRACTFCAIPSWRGGFRSRPMDEIVTEAGWLVERGVRELVLVSENTTSWGKDLEPGGRERQPELLAALSDIDRLERIRLMYLQPDELRRPLLEAMAELPKVASYFDLSLQHASASVLQRMARSGSPQRFRDLIAEIRGLDPHAVFRSNFIVGFPGETDEDLAELAAFLEDARLDWVGLFTFSPQEGTPAPDLAGQVPEDVAMDRLRALTDLQERIADERSRSFVGRRLSVTVDRVDEAGCWARSYREAPDTDGEIRLVTDDGRDVSLPLGRTTTAEIVAADGVDLVAVPELPS